MYRHLILLSLVLLSIDFAGQTNSQPLRLELEARPNTEPFQVVPFGEQGLLVILKTNEFEDRNNRKWAFAFYNTKMELQWEFIRPLFRNHEYGTYAVSDNEVSVLFFDIRVSAEANLQILTINPAQKMHRLAEGNTDRRYEPVRFTRYKNNCYIGLNSKNSCKVYQIDVETSEMEELDLNTSGGIFIENINVDSLSNQIIVLTSLRNERRRNALYLHRFDINGNEIAFKPIIKGENRKMATSAQYLGLSKGQYLVLGSYTAYPQRRSSSSTGAEGSRSTGFFKVLANEDNQTPLVQFYSFGELTNLENYIRGTIAEQRQRSIRRWFNRSRTSDFEHNLIVHRVLAHNDTYLLSGEAFTPDFRTVTTVAYDYYGRPVPRSYSVFDGYRYSHAIIVAFNRNGQLLWDNGMEMINVRTFDLYPKLVLYKDEDGLAMAYNHDGKIAWKQVNENKTITNISYANIESKYSKDRVNNEQSSRLIYWYGQYFLASGYQTIINNYLPDQNRRNIFYINKIAFD